MPIPRMFVGVFASGWVLAANYDNEFEIDWNEFPFFDNHWGTLKM